MRKMVFLLIAFAPPQQMLFGTADVILRRPSDPIIGWLAAPSRITPVTTSRALANGSIGLFLPAVKLRPPLIC